MRPAATGAFFPGGPRCGCVSSGVIGSLHCSSLTLHCPSSCPQVVFCAWKYLLLVRLRPLPEDSLRALWLPARLCGPHCGCESARVLASLIGSSPSGVRHLSRVYSSVWGPVGVAHPFHPSLLLGGVLVRLCGGPS